MTMKNSRSFLSLLATSLLTALLVGCALPPSGKTPDTLRVGYSPHYPPVSFAIGGQFAGLEADFARDLAAELHCQPVLVPLAREELEPALARGEVDIVMSGRTITPARALKVDFCDSYTDNPLVALVRAEDAGVFKSAEEICGTRAPIGVLRGTSGELFARRHCLNTKLVPVALRSDVPLHLTSRLYNLYIDDLAAVIDILLNSETTLELVPIPLYEQKLAWAVAPGNDGLRTAANAILAEWRQNGHLDALLDRWLTYRRALAASPAR